MYETPTARQGVSLPKTKDEFGALDKSVEVVEVCEAPNGREHRPQ